MACQPFSAPCGKHHEGTPGRNAHEPRCQAFKRSAADPHFRRANYMHTYASSWLAVGRDLDER
jgi:hypothetical protein